MPENHYETMIREYMKIRDNVYEYLHGHKVGGTSSGLLEALGSMDLTGK